MTATLGQQLELVDQVLANVRPSAPAAVMLTAPANNAGAALRSAYWLGLGWQETGNDSLRQKAQGLRDSVDAATWSGESTGAYLLDVATSPFNGPALDDPSGRELARGILQDAYGQLLAAGSVQSQAGMLQVVNQPLAQPGSADVWQFLSDSRETAADTATKVSAIGAAMYLVVAVVGLTLFLAFLYVLIRTYVPKIS